MDWVLFWTYVSQASLGLIFLSVPLALFVGAVGGAVSASVNRVNRAKADHDAVVHTIFSGQ